MRLRLAQPATAVVLGAVVLALIVAVVPLSELTHQSVLSNLANPFPYGFAVVGVLLAYRRPENSIGWLLLAAAGFIVADAAASLYNVAAFRDHHQLPLARVVALVQPSWAPAIVLFGVVFQVFPDGRVPRGRWRAVFWGFVGVGALWAGGAFAIAVSAVAGGRIRITPSGDFLQVDHPTGGWAWWGYVQEAWFPLIGVVLVAWLARELPAYRRATGEHRQQLKWLVGGAVVAVACGLVTISLSGNQGVLGAVGRASTAGLAALPVSVAIAVLRYRLYEIDRLISRTLSYAVVTGLLVGVFVGMVVLATDVLPFSSPVGVAASTLAAAALFNPLRVRVQRLVDRRFNRARYDAEAAVAAFAQRLREAVDLGSVQAGLLDAVGRAVEPAHLSIWIRDTGPR